jgi:hypothetical protein
MENKKQHYELKADKGSRVLCALLGLLFLIPALAAFFKNKSFFEGVIFSVALYLFPQVWFAGFRILICDDKLSYRTLFSGEHKIEYSKLQKAEIKTGLAHDDHGKSLPYYRLCLYATESGASKAPFVINMKPFTRDGLVMLAKAIVENAPNAKVCNKIRSLSQSDMQPIIKEGIGKIWQISIFVLILMILLGLLKALI